MKKMKMKAMAAVLTGCMVLGLAACGSGDTSSAGAAAEATETADSDLKEIDVVLDWYPNVIHTFLYDAVDKGYFEEEGLKVNLIPPAESVDALNFVASGKAQIGISYPVDIINGDVNSDMNVRAIGAVSQDTLSVLCALKDSGIDTEDMSTLKGKKIGYSGEESAKMEAISVAKAGGLSEDDYELVNVGFDGTGIVLDLNFPVLHAGEDELVQGLAQAVVIRGGTDRVRLRGLRGRLGGLAEGVGILMLGKRDGLPLILKHAAAEHKQRQGQRQKTAHHGSHLHSGKRKQMGHALTIPKKAAAPPDPRP